MMEMPPLPSPSWRETRPTNPPKMMAEWFGVEKMREYGELCARMAREQERERIAESVEKLVAGWDGPYRRSADLIVLAIRKG